MEIKKIRIIFVGGIIILFIIMIPIVPFCGDITQYKRIGETNYYLVESLGNEPYSDLHYRYENKHFGESVKYKGFAKDLYWNDTYLIIKCTGKRSTEINNYCIIKQQSSSQKNVPWEVYEYQTEKEFESAKKKLGLNEEEMEYTSSCIPWSLHLFD